LHRFAAKFRSTVEQTVEISPVRSGSGSGKEPGGAEGLRLIQIRLAAFNFEKI
jgi:hypothetical protein